MNKLSVAKVFNLEVESEICCDYCNEIVHNHIDCPVCETKYASTDQSCNLNEWQESTITCDICGSTFKLVTNDWYGYDEDTKAILVK